jgi:DNA processing protein
MMRPMIAIVGSRNASGAGLKFAGQLARDLSNAGFVVVGPRAWRRSGRPSRQHCRRHRGGARRRPRPDLSAEHRDLLAAIIEQGGSAISEMPLDHEPRARDFPRRNRLISGSALGVVVAEAAHRSGSLITARLAAEQGREVFAVPGSPLDPRAAGTNDLIKQGATLVTEASDIIHAITPIMERPLRPAFRESDDEPLAPDPQADERDRIVRLLGAVPVSIDDLIRMAETSAAIVRTVLLELAGKLERQGGGMVSLI